MTSYSVIISKMLRAILFYLCCLTWHVTSVDSARILGVFPVPSVSHQIVFRALMYELANNGHEIVIITPNPALPKERPPDNITEIDTSKVYQLMAKLYQDFQDKNMLKKGIVLDIDYLLTGESDKGMIELISYQFELPEVRALLEDKTQKFDLVFVEALASYHLIVTEIFKAPVIWFSSFFGFPEHYQSMGAVAYHPLFYPYFYRHKYRNLTLWQKIQELYIEWKIYKMVKDIEEHEDKKLQQRYGPDTPRIEELKKNVHMLFLNSHPLFANNRPVPPSVIYLRALHLKPVNNLPQELQNYLDNSVRGVVYVSFGSNVQPAMMDKELLDTFLAAFGALPFDVLWKFDGYLKNIPDNVKIQKWFPQRDLLMHPKIKVFITQGGLQSTDEAIDATVPLIGIPMLADQWYNVNKYEEFGIGEQIEALSFTKDDLINTVTKVITNDSYRNNIKKLRAIINDEPQKPLERAVWWTEHVLRHGGALHLRAPTANTTWSEYFMSDVMILIASVVSVFIIVIISIIYLILKWLRKNLKLKQS